MRSDLRAANEAKCERLLARSGLLESSDLAWDEVGTRVVDDGVLTCLAYMRDVEGFVDRDLVGLVAHPTTMADPIVRRFLDVWRAEETEHAHAIDRYLTLYAERRGITLPTMQAPPTTVPRSERVLVTLTRPVGHVITAAHMVWGAANELLTMHGYRLLARRCEEPVLAELLTRIAAQESRHYSFYLFQAQWRLAASRLSRVALRTMMKRSWTPVGIGYDYKTPAEFDQVLAFLAVDEVGTRAVETMDATFTRLPGFDELNIYDRAVTQSRSRLATAA
ncbi:MAG: acyl-ACP desaturase [Acidimicrobiales bacterium]